MQTLFSIFISIMCCCFMNSNDKTTKPEKDQVKEKVKKLEQLEETKPLPLNLE